MNKPRINPGTASRAKAFSLVELLLVVACMGLVAAAIYGVFGATLRLFTNGTSATRTGYALRDVYDRVAFDIVQSPGRFASPMLLYTSSNPPQLRESLGQASAALALCKVVAGPLMIENTFNSTNTVLIPAPPTDDTTDELIADVSQMNIQVGDYIKLIVGDATESKITAVNKVGNRWSLTYQTYNISYANNQTGIDDYAQIPVYVVRYRAYVVLRNLNVYGRARDCIAVYDNLEVAERRANIPYNPPSRFNLPTNYATAYNDLITLDVSRSTLAGAGDGYQPFRLNYNSSQPTVILQLGLEATEFDNLTTVPDFYKTVNLDTQVYLRSNDL